MMRARSPCSTASVSRSRIFRRCVIFMPRSKAATSFSRSTCSPTPTIRATCSACCNAPRSDAAPRRRASFVVCGEIFVHVHLLLPARDGGRDRPVAGNVRDGSDHVEDAVEGQVDADADGGPFGGARKRHGEGKRG